MGKESTFQCRRCRFNPWVGKIPWRRKWHPTPVPLLGKSHEQRNLPGYSPQGHRESDTTEVTEFTCTDPLRYGGGCPEGPYSSPARGCFVRQMLSRAEAASGVRHGGPSSWPRGGKGSAAGLAGWGRYTDKYPAVGWEGLWGAWRESGMRRDLQRRQSSGRTGAEGSCKRDGAGTVARVGGPGAIRRRRAP